MNTTTPDVLDVLTEAVRIATGNPTATPRPGQDTLTRDIWAALTTPGGSHVAAAATGIGKSLAYLVPACLSAATSGKRTVVSTESLGLQAQILDKDAPVVVQAVKEATGVHVEVAVLKGWSNYACLRSAVSTASTILGGDPTPRPLSDTQLRTLAQDVTSAADPTTPLPGALFTLDAGHNVNTTTVVDGFEHDTAALADLTAWALTTDGTGDKDTYPGDLTGPLWGTVSVTPAECVGVKKCPFGQQCRAAAAKERAADADVIVTNHALLAVQAARGVAVVIGSPRLGPIDAVVVDEAHALPSAVRNQGACEVSGRRVMQVVRALRDLLDASDRTVNAHLAGGEAIADHVDQELAAMLATPKAGRERVLRLTGGQDPLEQTGAVLDVWLGRSAKLLSTATARARGDVEVKVRRAAAKVEQATADLRAVSTHRTGVARWVEVETRGDRTWHVARANPVDVANLLQRNVWTTATGQDDEAPADGPADDGQDVNVDPVIRADTDRVRLSTVAVSATLPRSFAPQVNLPGPVARHTTPFIAAYDRCLLYVPTVTNPADRDAISTVGAGGRPRFDTGKHKDWAAVIMRRLVQTNRGAALVLSATADGGKSYAQMLRATTDHTVLSQWDGPPLRTLVARWREDQDAVLVGTRSLMTGVDAPGDTCSLVVIDRIPRAAGNPVDDARVEDLAARMGIDQWTADRGVYVADAALLLEQAAGRLIRSANDQGLLAVLDPRVLKVPPFAYRQQVRDLYLASVASFTRRTTDLAVAEEYLRVQAGARTAA